MASDLKVDIDNSRLNIRVGVIVKYGNNVLIEISKIGRNSVIPGGRIQINENSKNALVREMKEEMNFELNSNKLTKINVFENFFEDNTKKYHEIYFLYKYQLSETEYKILNSLNKNFDNNTTYFKFINKNELESYNLLPLEIHDYILND